MAKAPLTPENRILQARKLLQEARDLERPDSLGWEGFQYTAQVKDTLRKGFDLIKLISFSPSASKEVKAEAAALIQELKDAEGEILRKP
jgi:uncharacterized protein (UPF0128 family)